MKKKRSNPQSKTELSVGFGGQYRVTQLKKKSSVWVYKNHIFIAFAAQSHLFGFSRLLHDEMKTLLNFCKGKMFPTFTAF